MSLKTFDLIEAGLIKRAETNPRAELTELKSLAASIKIHGIIAPLVLSKQPDETFLILDGHRRFDAGLMAGVSHFPAAIRDDEDQVMTALITSSHTVKLSPLEQALAAGAMMAERGMKGAELAKLLAVSPTWTSKAKKIYDAVTEENGDRASMFTNFNDLYEWAVKQGIKKIGRPKAVIDNETFAQLKAGGYDLKKTAEGYAMTLSFKDVDSMLATIATLKTEVAKLTTNEKQSELAL